ncbi:MAG: tripartite tricarboxylate transporter substrate binding protein [Betaproteobacteria bacterium]|nr:tripartite tricarboxylate transporter substrate binding protein [Betaproteobacteria bacterium]
MRSASLVATLVSCAAILSHGGSGIAQGYPARPIRMIVPFPAGGGLDTIAREIAQKIGANIGQPLVVENRSGAGGSIGTEATARSTPDGYTILMTTDGHTMLPHLQKISWDPVRDFAAINVVGTYNLVLAVHPSVQVSSAAEFIALAKATPGKLSYGSSGVGGAAHIAFELFKNLAGVDIVHVPYKGFAALVTAQISGEVPVAINGIAAVPHIRNGKLRGLGVIGSKRWAVLPELPTVAESALPGFIFEGWIGLLAPAGTPRDAIALLNAETVKAVNASDVRTRLSGLGFDPASSTPENFGAMIASDVAKFGKLIKGLGIAAN